MPLWLQLGLNLGPVYSCGFIWLRLQLGMGQVDQKSLNVVATLHFKGIGEILRWTIIR